MPTNGQLSLERTIPTLTALPRALYARAESLTAGSWTSPHRHDWVQFSYAISGVLGVHTAEGSSLRRRSGVSGFRRISNTRW